jgi:TPP-dependent pyruvate/acetoin dehydrogenase alpha subunit
MEPPNEQLIRLYGKLVRTKIFDRAVVNGIAEGKILSFFHNARGHETLGAGASGVPRQNDYVSIHHRG